MGKRGGKGFGGGRGRGGRRSAPRQDFKDLPKENERFQRYYDALKVVEEDEHEQFWAALRRELPNSFRFAGSKGHALSVQRRLREHYVPEIAAIDSYEGEKVDPPFVIPWYPDELAWAMTTPKNIVRRHPPFASFQRFLVSETSVGNISRQEAVSMIPPLLMDIRPGMTVLDMCAAPGSKAAQLIEMVHAGEELRVRQRLRRIAKHEGRAPSPEDVETAAELVVEEDGTATDEWTDDGRSTGLLIANDADYKRSHMLIHQMKRLNSPNLIVTNHDATMFPSIRLTSTPGPQGQRPRTRWLKFDRILADVPCSGDGTSRKNPNVWRDWSPANALGLHTTQARILVRALQMLKVGGRVVYSTCSMNPIENEAVVASAVDRCGGLAKVAILDTATELPALIRRPGLTRWAVMDKTGRIWSSWDEVEMQRKAHGEDGLGRLTEGMFPPSSSPPPEGQAPAPLPLGRCMRVYPHLQDTGGFFIAVLEKKAEIRARPEGEPKPAATKPPAPKPLISATIQGILNTVEHSTDVVEKLDALDEILPPHDDMLEDASAAARQNQENAPDRSSTLKRGVELQDDALDAAGATKRLKVKDDADPAAPRGDEDRPVHWPPPPGAGSPRASASPPAPEVEPAAARPDPSTKAKGGSYEEPFKYLSPDHPELQKIYDFYGVSPLFPRDRFLVRNATGDPVKTIYYSSELAREILTENESKGIKFVHCGVKMFMRQDVQRIETCKWRIQTEGMPLLEGWVGEQRVVRMHSRETLRRLLVEMFPKVSHDGWTALAEIGTRVRDLAMGCCVLKVEPTKGDDGFEQRMVLPLWRSLHSLNLMLPKEDRSAMLLRLFNDTTPLEHMPPRHPPRSGTDTPNDVDTAATPINGEEQGAPNGDSNGLITIVKDDDTIDVKEALTSSKEMEVDGKVDVEARAVEEH
ncbi:MAG: hypothetical protein M1838_000369 [Thelocarpon superellum]|nr:MAG: hypothetical protein M1838_000369 [Thelocarpon superellum]